jgi:hypothetical protein
MNNSQKGSANAILIILIVLLAAAVAYFALIKKPNPLVQSQNSATVSQPLSATNNQTVPFSTPLSQTTSPSSVSTGYSSKTSDTVSVKNGVVYINGNLPVAGADPSTFQLLGGDFAKDSTHIWHYDPAVGITNQTKLEQRVDIASFADLNDSYVKDKNGVYEGDLYNLEGGAPLKLMSGIDTNTAVALDAGNIKDANHAYDFEGNMFSNITDAKTLVGLGQNSNGDSQWFKDSVHVYAGDGEIVSNANPATFKDIGAGYGEDKSNVFYDGNVETFVVTGMTAPTGSIVAGADLNSFVVIGNNYAKDSSHVYENGKQLLDADPATFHQIGTSLFFEDKSHVWYTGQNNEAYFDEIPQADPVTFTVGSNGVQDANNTYTFDGRGNLTVTPKN